MITQHFETLRVIALVFYLCLPDPRAGTEHMNSNKCGMSHWEHMKARIKTNCSIDNGVTVPPCTDHCPVHVSHTYWHNPQTASWSRSHYYAAYGAQSFNMRYTGNAWWSFNSNPSSLSWESAPLITLYYLNNYFILQNSRAGRNTQMPLLVHFYLIKIITIWVVCRTLLSNFPSNFL